jgi:5-methylcytosine-specific restriction endonuclease McrBC regulatory subunit McrC
MPDERYSFIVGENGRRSGLAVAGTANAEVRILVLPKAWRNGKAAITTEPLLGREGVSVSIVCYEGDKIVLKPKATGMRAWPGIEQCCKSIADEAEQKAGKRRAALVLPRASKKDDRTLYVEETGMPQGSQSPIRKMWEAFLKLRQRAQKVRAQARQDKDLFADLGTVSALESANSLLAPLVRSSFVRRVEDQIHHVRPGYVRVTEPSRYVRGRMHPVSAAIAMAGGSDTVVCTFDTFGLDTPLLRVIAAALREVAAGDPPGAVPTHPEAIATAHWLLGKLEAVHEIPREQAARIGHALLPGLPRLDADWREPLRLACLVLDEMAQEPLSDASQGYFGWQGAEVASFIFDVNTSTYWERIVRNAWPGKAKKGPRKLAWKRSTDTGDDNARLEGMQADIVVSRKKTKVVADVKYADYEAATSAPVQRQIFAYSHLYKADRTFVVYLEGSSDRQEEDKQEEQKAVLYRQPRDNAAGPCETDVTCQFIGLQFPSVAEVQEEADWKTYMKNLGECLQSKTKT